MREVKHLAVEEDKKLKDTVAELLRIGLAEKSGEPRVIRNRVKLPLIYGTRKPEPDELSPERLKEILLDEETRAALDAMR